MVDVKIRRRKLAAAGVQESRDTSSCRNAGVTVAVSFRLFFSHGELPVKR